MQSEAKWRYSLYKSWLGFLEEGLGDGFDEVPLEESESDTNVNNANVRAKAYEAWLERKFATESVEEWADMADYSDNDSGAGNDVIDRPIEKSTW